MKSGVIWLTGLAGAGKTTFASELFKYLKQSHKNTILLDGDVFRNIFGESGFTRDERLKIAYKINALVSFLEQNQLLVIVATMSLFDEIYTLNRTNFKNYFEVYIKCDFNELIRRDKKALYSKALNREIQNVVGVDIKFDEPKAHFVLENNQAVDLDKKNKMLFTKIDEFLSKTKENENIDDKNYWKNYYQKHLSDNKEKESLFASFCLENFFQEGSKLIELGCGNGRDSVYFAKHGINTLGIDQCENIIDFLNQKYKSENLNFQSGDFTALKDVKEKFDIVYSRFTLHSINAKQEKLVFDWVKSNLRMGGGF